MILHAAFEFTLVIFALTAAVSVLPNLFSVKIRDNFHFTLKSKMFIIWKRYQVFSPIAERLVEKIKEKFGKNIFKNSNASVK